MTEHPEPETAVRPARRRASRPAGPASGDAGPIVVTAGVEPAATTPTARPIAAPPRRRPNGFAVGLVAGLCALALLGGLGWGVWELNAQRQTAAAAEARYQRFVDTGAQGVVNMFSYTQDTIDQSVKTFVDGTSGPLREMMSQPGNVENLKAMFRDTQSSSEAVIKGAALEKVDEISRQASVLVAVRVTVTGEDGLNSPSQAFRMRVTVNEDDNGRMTLYDLKYPDGGN